MTFSLKDYLGGLSVLIALIGYIPYIWTVRGGQTKPHIFSWIIWTTLESIAFAAQYAAHGGPGAWVTGLTALGCLTIAVMAFKKGEKNITRNDKIIFTGALLAIPIWVITKNPLWSVILITFIDIAGFVPTYRKAYYKPYEEMIWNYLVSAIKCGISIFAMEQLSLTTALYPASLVVTNTVFVCMVLIRRRHEQLSKFR